MANLVGTGSGYESSGEADESTLIRNFDGCPAHSSDDGDLTPCLACNECKARQDSIDELEKQVADLKRQKKLWENEELKLTKQLNDLYAGQNAGFHSL